MAKFVVEGAQLSCQYGTKSCGLTALKDRHITTGKEKRLGNELDGITACSMTTCSHCFGICRSPYNIENNSLMLHALAPKGIQQLVVYEGGDMENLGIEDFEIASCKFIPALLWQNVNQHVQIAKYKALMEDGWTICAKGLGIVSAITHGQEEDIDEIKEMQQKLKELDIIIKQYMEENGIKSKEKDALIESILLWNGYATVPWEYKSSETNRKFCSWLEKENPELFNYFERGLYVGEGKNRIDLTYMLGIYKTSGHGKVIEDYITVEMTEDFGMFNGYMEASRIEQGKNLYETLSDFLSYYSSSDYEDQSRYEDYVTRTSEEIRTYYCRDYNIDASKVAVQDINLMMLEHTLSENQYAQKAAGAFMEQLKSTLRKR